MTHETTLISAETLAGQIDKLILIDCRSDLFDPELGQKQYEAGHIPKAAFFALHQVLSGPKSPTGGRHPLPDPEQLVQAMRDLAEKIHGMNIDAYSSVAETTMLAD
ncbi:MAG: hypothetical protein EBV92_10765, partial [Betaproteobacteria bacterium]|nr:hypothetical protein [Betaproteobacteria bacterium]